MCNSPGTSCRLRRAVGISSAYHQSGVEGAHSALILWKSSLTAWPCGSPPYSLLTKEPPLLPQNGKKCDPHPAVVEREQAALFSCSGGQTLRKTGWPSAEPVFSLLYRTPQAFLGFWAAAAQCYSGALDAIKAASRFCPKTLFLSPKTLNPLSTLAPKAEFQSARL